MKKMFFVVAAMSHQQPPSCAGQFPRFLFG